MDRFPYVRREGLGTAFLRGGSRRSLLAGSAVAVVATMVLTGPLGLLLTAAAGLIAGAVGAWAKRRIGGVTGRHLRGGMRNERSRGARAGGGHHPG